MHIMELMNFLLMTAQIGRLLGNFRVQHLDIHLVKNMELR